ncbi:unnamed protein product [Closterium sp. NIES-64]|nr:unnamed protein product [Closterium sp. NIES-64]
MQSTSAPGGPHSANRATGGAAAPPPAHGPPMSAGGGDHPHGAGGGDVRGRRSGSGGLVQAGLAQAGAGSTAGVAELSKAAARRVVDLRSDTVTKPTGAMREAMKNADVDDDVIGIDPTVDRLQRQVATMMGKEAGLFVPSGTMGNLICVLVHCEGGVARRHWGPGVHPRTVVNKADGTMDLKKVETLESTQKGLQEGGAAWLSPLLQPLSPPFLNHSPALSARSLRDGTGAGQQDGTMDLKKVELAYLCPPLFTPLSPLPQTTLLLFRSPSLRDGTGSRHVHPRTVVNKADGTMDLKKVELAIRKDR